MYRLKNCQSGLILAGLLAASAAARADDTVTVPWYETGSSFGDASGTLTAEDSGGDEFYETAITGSFTSGPLAGDAVTYYGQAFMNGLFTSSDALTADTLQSEYFDFAVDGKFCEFFGSSTATTIDDFTDDTHDAGTDVFSLTPPVPEPGTIALGAVGGLAFLRFRQRK